jgi:hypothetical protein
MKEEYKPFCVSILVGIIAGVLTFFLMILIGDVIGPFPYIFYCIVILPLSVIILSSVLSRKFFLAWEKIRARFYCIILLLITYLYSYCCIPIVEEWSSIGEFFRSLLIPFIYIIIGFMLFPLLFFKFLYPTIITFITTIVAAYVATSGIKNLPKRIILAFALAVLIYGVALALFIMHSGY